MTATKKTTKQTTATATKEINLSMVGFEYSVKAKEGYNKILINFEYQNLDDGKTFKSIKTYASTAETKVLETILEDYKDRLEMIDGKARSYLIFGSKGMIK